MTAPTTHLLARDLGDGLVMRPPTAADLEALDAFGKEIFGPRAGAWMRHIARGGTPFGGPDTCLVVEDTATNQLISSVGLLSQNWEYDGIPLRVGQPEFVLSRPEYRRKGLVRAQFAALHALSEARGDHLQAITGIPYYYRQFGYEMTLPLGGARIAIKHFVPKLKEGESEPYTLRPATAEDLPFITMLYAANNRRRSLVTNVYDEATWGYILNGWRGEPFEEALRIVQNPSGERVGFLLHHGWLRPMQQLAIGTYELAPGISWAAATLSVLRALVAIGEEMAAQNRALAATLDTVDQRLRDTLECTFINLWLGHTHPAYDALPQTFSKEQARKYDAYAWYIRVPDLTRFLWHIQPVLERRLAASVLAGYSGEFKIGFYRRGLVLTFTAGRLTAIAPFTPESEKWGDAMFPDLTFLHLLFGHRTVEELNVIYADCYAEGDLGEAMTPILFPKRPSVVQSWSSDG